MRAKGAEEKGVPLLCWVGKRTRVTEWMWSQEMKTKDAGVAVQSNRVVKEEDIIIGCEDQ